MSRTPLFVAFLLAPLLIAQPPAKKGGPPNLATQQVKPGLFMITGAGANTEVRVTNDGLIVVDGKLPGDENYNALMDQIKMISTQPIMLERGVPS